MANVLEFRELVQHCSRLSYSRHRFETFQIEIPDALKDDSSRSQWRFTQFMKELPQQFRDVCENDSRCSQIEFYSLPQILSDALDGDFIYFRLYSPHDSCVIILELKVNNRYLKTYLHK